MKRLNTAIYIDLAFCLVLLPVLIMMLPIDKWMEQRPTFVVLLIVWLYILYGLLRFMIVPQIFKKRHALAIGLFLSTIFVTHELTLIELDFRYKAPTTSQQSTTNERAESQNQGGGTQNQQQRQPQVGQGQAQVQGQQSGEQQSNQGQEAAQRQGQRSRPESSPDLRMAARRNFTQQQQQSGWFLYVLVVSFGYAVALLSQLNKQISLNKDMALEKKRAELALYKAQINPHFLFNTLNTIYGLIITKSDEAEEAFMLFTNLMKYIYTNGSADQIPVDDEVEYIKQYIGLQSLRINESTEVAFDYRNNESGCPTLNIAPMLLITFVENAFKYGVSSHTPSKIMIDIDVTDKQLRLTTHNPILNDNKKAESSEGIGIKNCRQRLQLLYPKRHTLSISDNGAEYNLELTIQLV